jgi:hypothetical protein
METPLLPQIDFDARDDEDLKVHDWRAHQLQRLGLPRMVAEAFAGTVDWHDVAALVGSGCPISLAVEIARQPARPSNDGGVSGQPTVAAFTRT